MFTRSFVKIFIQKNSCGQAVATGESKPWIDFESSDSTIGKSCNEKFRSRNYVFPRKSETKSNLHKAPMKHRVA